MAQGAKGRASGAGSRRRLRLSFFWPSFAAANSPKTRGQTGHDLNPLFLPREHRCSAEWSRGKSGPQRSLLGYRWAAPDMMSLPPCCPWAFAPACRGRAWWPQSAPGDCSTAIPSAGSGQALAVTADGRSRSFGSPCYVTWQGRPRQLTGGAAMADHGRDARATAGEAARPR